MTTDRLKELLETVKQAGYEVQELHEGDFHLKVSPASKLQQKTRHPNKEVPEEEELDFRFPA